MYSLPFAYGIQIISHTMMKYEIIYAINTGVNLNTAQNVPILAWHERVNLSILHHTNSMGSRH